MQEERTTKDDDAWWEIEKKWSSSCLIALLLHTCMHSEEYGNWNTKQQFSLVQKESRKEYTIWLFHSLLLELNYDVIRMKGFRPDNMEFQ